MRILPFVIGVLLVAVPAQGIARPRPKIAVAPLGDDAGNKVAQAVADALAGKDFAVVGPKETGREMTRLGLSDELDARAARTLAQKLGAVAVVTGQVSKAGRKRSLHLEVHRRGKPDAGFTVEYKTTSSPKFRRVVHDQIGKKLEGAGEPEPADEDKAGKPVARADHEADNRAAARPRKLTDDDADDTAGRKPRADKQADDDAAARPRRKLAEADGDDTAGRKRKAGEADPKAGTRADSDAGSDAGSDAAPRRPRKPAGDDARKRRVAATHDDGDGDGDGDGEGAVRTRKTRKAGGEAAPQLAARVAAGGSVAQRQLSYDTRSGFTQVPPRVLTTAGAARVDGEIYPFALADPGSSLAGLGLAAAYDKTFGLSIKLPNQTISAPISQSHYAIGARYRFGVGAASTVALGLDYARRQYVADRSGLMAAVLDAPDVDYTAIAPGAAVRVPVTGTIAVFGAADGMLILQAGAIQKSASYGPATVYGLEGAGGVEIALTPQIGLRLAIEYSQIMFAFKPKGPTLANNRDNDPATQDVTGATDRSIGVAVTVGLAY